MNLTVTVPGSTSNLGSGFDCLGIAVDFRLTIEVSDGTGKVSYRGSLAALDPSADIVRSRLEREGLMETIDLAAQSDIPLSRGLGSSGAAAVAAEALVSALRGEILDNDSIFQKACEKEGHPDNVAPSLFGGAILTTRHPTPIAVHDDLVLAFAIPERPVETAAARKLLPVHIERTAAIRQSTRLGALLIGLREANGELIAEGMKDEIAVPLRRKLIDGFDEAEVAGAAAGAHGVTISGSGSTTVAVCNRHKGRSVAEAMAAALTKKGNLAVPFVSQIAKRGLEVSG